MSALVQPYQCIQCLAFQTETAREDCKNPTWHVAPPSEPKSAVAEPEPEEDGPFS